MSAEKEHEITEILGISADKKQKPKKAGTEVEYKWTDKQVEALICEWASEPCLYNVAHAAAFFLRSSIVFEIHNFTRLSLANVPQIL